MEKPQRILLINANCGNFVWFGRQKVFNRSRLLPLSSPYFIRLSRQFPYLFAKIQINIEIYKYIEKKVPIVETIIRHSSLYIIICTHMDSFNGSNLKVRPILRNQA